MTGTAHDAPRSRGRRVTVAIAALVLLAAAALAGTTAWKSGEPAADGPEAGFARDMSAHHAQAVEMSFIVRDRTSDPAVRMLAYDIINTQSAQIGMMTAVRAAGSSACPLTREADSASGSPRSETQKPIAAVMKPLTTQAESRPNRTS